MASNTNGSKLKKELGLFRVFSLALGTTLSAGFFLLPGIAAKEAGPAMVLAYLLAAIPLIPSMFSMVELATAMPRAGGAYYFLDRSMGPLVGTIGGFGTWFALMLKTAFALIGMGYYLHIFFPNLPSVPVAVALALSFGVLNLLGARKSASFQVLLVMGLLAILAWFIGTGFPRVQPEHFQGFFEKGFDRILSTAGMVYISYVGITQIASVAEEVSDPERNLPRGVFLAMGTSVVVYVFGTWVMVGVIPMESLQQDLTPVATAGKMFAGRGGQVVVTVAALLAFFSVANAGILSASRYPLAMGRDHLLPSVFRRITGGGTPLIGVLSTVGIIIALLLAFDPTKIAKLASAFQLLMFAMICLAVIVMRESQIESYDPSYRSPGYPWMQISGIFLPIWLIAQMGWLTVLFTTALIVGSGIWYFRYARPRVVRDGAVYHVFERLGRRRYEPLDTELRTILKEKGLRDSDPFEEIVAHAGFIDIRDVTGFDEITRRASLRLASAVKEHPQRLFEGFIQGKRVGATPVDHGIALPHVRLPGLDRPHMVMVRTREGIQVDVDSGLWTEQSEPQCIFAFFFLASPQEDAGQHLRLLAEIAQHVDQEEFMDLWMGASDERQIKELLLRDEWSLAIQLTENTPAAEWIGKRVHELQLPSGCLIALIHRDALTVVPRGGTQLNCGDQLTIIGEPNVLRELHARFIGEPHIRVSNPTGIGDDV